VKADRLSVQLPRERRDATVGGASPCRCCPRRPPNSGPYPYLRPCLLLAQQLAVWRDQCWNQILTMLATNEFVTPANYQNHALHGFPKTCCFFFAASAAKFSKQDFSSASENAFPGILECFFSCSISSKRVVQLHIKSLPRPIATNDLSFPKKT